MLPRGLLKEYGRMLSMMIRIMDMAVILSAGWLAWVIKFDGMEINFQYLVAILFGVLFTPLVFTFFNIYASIRVKGFTGHFINLFQAVCVLTFILGGLAFFTKTGESYSRLWFFIWMSSALSLLIIYRCCVLLFLRFMRSHGLNERRVVIFGAGELGERFAGTVQQALWTGFHITAFIDDDAEHKPASLHHIPVLKTPADLSAYLAKENIDELWLALPLHAQTRVQEVLFGLRHMTITMRFVVGLFGLDLLNYSVTDIAGFPVLNIRSTPMIGFNRLIKAIEDRMIAALILVCISPLLILIATGIKLTSRGPIFFRQERLGWDGRVIKIYKFRTMYLHHEEDGKVTQATQDDKRITPFGKFLRRTSLDELPQFINVLQGCMSIVGPRRHALAHNELYKESIHTYMQRHHVKPGITGWAQINGWRGETDTLSKMEKRVEYDLYYINNWSLGFDLKIILLTILRGFINRNAY